MAALALPVPIGKRSLISLQQRIVENRQKFWVKHPLRPVGSRCLS